MKYILTKEMLIKVTKTNIDRELELERLRNLEKNCLMLFLFNVILFINNIFSIFNIIKKYLLL